MFRKSQMPIQAAVVGDYFAMPDRDDE